VRTPPTRRWAETPGSPRDITPPTRLRGPHLAARPPVAISGGDPGRGPGLKPWPGPQRFQAPRPSPTCAFYPAFVWPRPREARAGTSKSTGRTPKIRGPAKKNLGPPAQKREEGKGREGGRGQRPPGGKIGGGSGRPPTPAHSSDRLDPQIRTTVPTRRWPGPSSSRPPGLPRELCLTSPLSASLFPCLPLPQ